MKSFIKSFGPSTSSKEKLITDNLIAKLSECVKDIQASQSGDELLALLDNDGSSALCTVLEAIFLHGLKDSLFQLATKAFKSDRDQFRPDLSFWSFLLVFSHNQIINQIQSLQQITTDVGYCRAWLRLALNDNLLSSYLQSMQRDSHVLKQFYKQHAFLRNPELLDYAQNLLHGVETIATFNLAVNSSLLNYWSSSPLIMAGLWSTLLKSCPIPSGFDIATTLDALETISDTSQSTSISNLLLNNSPTTNSMGIGQFTALNEGEALRIILQKSTEIERQNSIEQSEASTQSIDSKSVDNAVVSSKDNSLTTTNTTSSCGNSLNVCGWSFEHDNNTMIQSTPIETFADGSYNALIDNYNINSVHKTSSTLQPLAGCSDCELFDSEESEQEKISIRLNDPLLQSLDYEIISSQNIIADDAKFRIYIGKLAREKGLDKQEYICNTCCNQLGISFAKPKVCTFTGDYFCEDCMSTTLHLIPAKVLFNWDFRKYPVSKRADMFLTDLKHFPVINIKDINVNIYAMIDKMSELLNLRAQLNFLRAYLYTCREPIIKQLQRKVWPREHLYESIHQYSIADLELIPENELVTQLKEIILFARNHVFSCGLCIQKGFICEMCDSSEVLYPFDLETTFRCVTCNAVFHRTCFERSNDCLRCRRRLDRLLTL